MKLLLDTHAYLWWLADDRRLKPRVRHAISKPSSRIWVSAASVWEISIKLALGRIDLKGNDVVHEIEANDFDELHITAAHAELAGSLPLHHNDPFDRMLVAQAQLEGMRLVTRDRALGDYGVAVLAT